MSGARVSPYAMNQIDHTRCPKLSKEAVALVEAAIAVSPVGRPRPAALLFFRLAARRMKLKPAERVELLERLERIMGGRA